jgi:hypothetical protein
MDPVSAKEYGLIDEVMVPREKLVRVTKDR